MKNPVYLLNSEHHKIVEYKGKFWSFGKRTTAEKAIKEQEPIAVSLHIEFVRNGQPVHYFRTGESFPISENEKIYTDLDWLEALEWGEAFLVSENETIHTDLDWLETLEEGEGFEPVNTSALAVKMRTFLKASPYISVNGLLNTEILKPRNIKYELLKGYINKGKFPMRTSYFWEVALPFHKTLKQLFKGY